MTTRHNRTPAQRAELQAKKQALLADILASGDWSKMQKYDPLSLTKWSVAELETVRERMRYDEAHPTHFKGDGKQALKDLCGEE